MDVTVYIIVFLLLAAVGALAVIVDLSKEMREAQEEEGRDKR